MSIDVEPAATPADRSHWFLGTRIELRAAAADTSGQLAVFEQLAPRGFSPPRHVHHREDSALLVLEGQITVLVGDDRHVLGDGGFVWLPRDVVHTFRVDSETVRQLELVTPAGFEEFHVAAGDPASGPGLPVPAPPDIDRLLTVIESYGAEIVGPPLGPRD